MPSVPLMQKDLSHSKSRLQSVRSSDVVAPFGPEGIDRKLQAQPRVSYKIRYLDQKDILTITRPQNSTNALQHTYISLMSRWLQIIVSSQENPDSFCVLDVFRTQTGRHIARGS